MCCKQRRAKALDTVNESVLPQKSLLSACTAATLLTQLSGRTSHGEIFGK